MKRPPVWTARCKSEYQFRVAGKYQTCNRSCARGELICSECATAETVPSSRRELVIPAYVASILASLTSLTGLRNAEVTR